MLGFKQLPGVKHKDVYLIVFDATKKLMFSDQTEKFPITCWLLCSKNILFTLHILSLTPASLLWFGICEGQFHGIGFFFSEKVWTFSFLNPKLFFLLH